MHIIKQILKWFFGIAFVLAGALHFIYAGFYLKIMPPFLPAPRFLVYLSGVFEIVLGILFLIPKYTHLAAYGLIGLLIAVFPANIYMAANAEKFPEYSLSALYLRLPLQVVLIAFVYWFTRRKNLD
jgi:uncharacterized membrane protein